LCEHSPRFLMLARPERFELPTSWFVARHSIQLSYGRAVFGSASGMEEADTETRPRRGIPWPPCSRPELRRCAKPWSRRGRASYHIVEFPHLFRRRKGVRGDMD